MDRGGSCTLAAVTGTITNARMGLKKQAMQKMALVPHLGALLLLHIGGGAAGLLGPGGLVLAVLADFLLLLVLVAAEAEGESHLIGGSSDHILWQVRSGLVASVQA